MMADNHHQYYNLAAMSVHGVDRLELVRVRDYSSLGTDSSADYPDSRDRCVACPRLLAAIFVRDGLP